MNAMQPRTAKAQGNMQVHVASNPLEIRQVLEFRYRALVHDAGFDGPTVDHEAETVSDDLDRMATQLFVVADGRIVAGLRLFSGRAMKKLPRMLEAYGLRAFESQPLASLFFIDRLVVAKAWHATQVPSVLCAAAFKLAQNRGAQFLFSHTAPALAGLYEKLGFRVYTDSFSDPEVGLQVPMVLVMNDTKHMSDLNSPFARLGGGGSLDMAPVAWFRQTFPEAAVNGAKALRNEDQFWRYLTDRLHQTPLHGIPLFNEVAYRDAQRFMRNASLLNLNKGQTLMRSGHVGDELYVLLSGIVQVRTDKTGPILANFSKGAILGEVGFVSSTTRTAEVIATEPSEVLVLTSQTLKKFMADTPAVAAQILFNLCHVLGERLRMTNQYTRQGAEF